eukprot:CAMPEP_0206397764 /NCGR_PEP_ID=MMETSP0294-20121207/23726_1 /ASSEMBLY_ACC=CAM_ASM_000327 /TAXON_ID=39354 /ORGANISM="Heterosigma akashiwo, Strain CCMP2393" /LENGTH=91 /DNA_ID=CAMNT_0053853051 /DNA_START=366 /DNA_END=639 /DNA_ORIENTATION=+
MSHQYEQAEEIDEERGQVLESSGTASSSSACASFVRGGRWALARARAALRALTAATRWSSNPLSARRVNRVGTTSKCTAKRCRVGRDAALV